MQSIILLLFCCAFVTGCVDNDGFVEEHRLQLHFSVPSGWLNDPNGLVYHNGIYHLFYQHYPYNTKWGPMHWGHAQSSDLIHWENMPIALKPYEKGDIFSGCCIVDVDNKIGVAINAMNPPLIAFYTLNNDGSQSQAIAYSLNDGLTWTHYKNNPVIPNPGLKDFRDPNIVKRNGIYIMALAAGDEIMFYSSNDLKTWTRLSKFGLQPNQGDKSGVWECPALISLKDDQGNEHDILIVSENGASRGSLMQYFIGKFDGTKFTNNHGASNVLWVDHGPDNYAAVPYHDDPLGRTILIGWMSNWLYGADIPTSTWRGQMTIPRQLALKNVDGKVHLVQQPIAELNKIVDTSRKWSLPESIVIKNGENTIDLTSEIPFKMGSMLSLEYTVNIDAVYDGKIGLRFSNHLGEFVSFYYYIHERVYEFDRRNSGKTTFNQRFAGEVMRVNRISTSNLLNAYIILDVGSIEIFADDGLNTVTALTFPTVPYEFIEIYSVVAEGDTEKSVTVEKMTITALKSIWN